MNSNETPEIAMLKVAPTMAILVEYHHALEYAEKGMCSMSNPNDYQLLERGEIVTLPIVLTPHPDQVGRYTEGDPVEMSGPYVGVVQYVRVMDGWPVFGGVMAEETALLYGIEIGGKLFCAYAKPKDEEISDD